MGAPKNFLVLLTSWSWEHQCYQVKKLISSPGPEPVRVPGRVPGPRVSGPPWRPLMSSPGLYQRFSTEWYDSARHGSELHGTVRVGLLFHCSLVSQSGRDYSRRYSCAASTAVTPEKLFTSASLHHALAGSKSCIFQLCNNYIPYPQTAFKGGGGGGVNNAVSSIKSYLHC